MTRKPMTSTLRQFLVGFALVAVGIMVANALLDLVPPRTWLMYPVWVVLCLVPAYWYGHRIGVVSYHPWEIAGTIVAVLAAIAVVALWEKIRPIHAVGLAAVVCLFFLFRRRWTPKRGGTKDRCPSK